MKTKKETTFSDALKTVNAYFAAVPEDRPKLLERVQAANKVIADFARASEREARTARANFKAAKGILDCSWLKTKLDQMR